MRMPREIAGVPVVPVRLTSHRARDGACRIVERTHSETLHRYKNPYGVDRASLFCVHRPSGNGTIYSDWIYLVSADVADEVLRLRGAAIVKRFADDDEWSAPWDQTRALHLATISSGT